MKLSSPIFKLKRQARLLARRKGIPLHQALDLTAETQGFRSWSHLSSSANTASHDERIFNQLAPGDLLLLGARPGQGKTILGLDLAVLASKSGWNSHFFTLEYTEPEVLARYHEMGRDQTQLKDHVVIDTSDDISAEHILDQLVRPARDAFVVIDYLQLMDQKRVHPNLSTQIQMLKAGAASKGFIVVAISQVDRAFDLSGRQCPGLSDIRLPNPLDLSLFDKACFLHDGDVRFQRAA